MKRFLVSLVVFSVIVVVTSALLLSMPTGKNYAQGWDGDTSKSGLYDEKGLYSDTEAAELTKKIRDTASAVHMNIAVYLSPVYRSDYSAEIFADDAYDEKFGEDTDGILYYMDVAGGSDACDWISTSGRAVLLYQERIETIFSHLDDYLPSSYEISQASGGIYDFKDGISDAISAFLSDIASYSDSAYEASSYTDTSSGKYFFRKNGTLYVTKSVPPSKKLPLLWGSEVLGALVTLIAYSIGKSSYKFKNNTNPSVYVYSDETKLTEVTDRFMRSYVTKHRIESNSSGSRGGGGGGHSFSGGHGGGGHHR